MRKTTAIATAAFVTAAFAALVATLIADTAFAARVKDVAYVEGIRENDLVGYGVVVGLMGTGDTAQTVVTSQTIANQLNALGIRIDPKMFRTRNAAAVMVTAKLPAFASSGLKLDVGVASLGDAKSLVGGTLLYTPLVGSDRRNYAFAQGPVTTGGFAVAAAGTSTVKNVTTAGRIPGGAMVQQGVALELKDLPALVFHLNHPDAKTAQALAIALAKAGVTARPLDSARVEVQLADGDKARMVELIAKLEDQPLETDAAARVVVNERTGTVIVSAAVRIKPVAVAHGSLTISVNAANAVSQPRSFGQGTTTPIQNARVVATEQPATLQVVHAGARLEDLVKALNALGATPRELIDIFQAMRTARALDAEIVVE